MALQPGTTLGPYEIQAPLGAGGMGEVYKATDTRLDRTVAIKVLLAHVADDPDLRQRFEREAKTISSLNHPHICTLHDIGQQDGTDYLVMEYLEGETLAARLTKGPLPTDQVLRYATEIADALDKAHRKGITHRDLKPGNIMITKAGTKLLDFGLAKLKQPAAGAGGMSAVPTLSAGLTMQGTILGTLQYMAPEQLEGAEADARTDIFAFGAVVYEMATGRKAFEGKSQATLIHAIMGVDPPPISTIQPVTPPALDQIVKTCLAKDPDDRWQSAGDLGRQLKIIQGGSQPSVSAPAVAATPQRASWRQGIPLAVATLLVGSLITGVAVWSAMRPAPPRLARFPLTSSARAPLALANAGHDIAISPDGTRVVYKINPGSEAQLAVRAIDQLLGTPLEGLDAAVFGPFISADGAWVGFNDLGDGTLKRASILGGPAVLICDLGAPQLRGASWGPDDTIIFGTNVYSGLWRVSAGGGEPTEVTTRDPAVPAQNHAWPEILPGGRAVLFTVLAGIIDENPQIALLNLDTGEQHVLVPGGSYPRYSPTGHIVYGSGGTLRAVGFDLDRLTLTTTPVPVVDGVVTKGSGAADFDIADDGTLVYLPDATDEQNTLAWVNREGVVTTSLVEGIGLGWPRLSPDGNRVALRKLSDGGDEDLWIRDLARGSETKLTETGGPNQHPVWTPDGRTVTFGRGGAPRELFSRPVDLSEPAEMIRPTEGSSNPGSWTPDGQTLVYYATSTARGDRDIWMLPRDGDPAVFLATEFNERAPRLSPNGEWLGYISNQTGEDRVFVQAFPQGGEVFPISTGPGTEAVWSRDGTELFYRNGTQMWVVDVETESAFTAGRPSLLFEAPYDLELYNGGVGYANYDVSLNGEHFLMVQSGAAAESPDLSSC